MANDHYVLGETIYEHKGKSIRSIVGSEQAAEAIKEMNETPPARFSNAVLPDSYKYRPDLISNDLFDTVGKWWKVLVFNNMVDAFEELKTGTYIKFTDD